MRDSLYLAWRYVAYHRIKTGIVMLSIALILFVPVGLRFLVTESAKQLTARADATPLLIGAKGSPLELVLSSIYFRADEPESIAYAQFRRVADSGLAQAIPLHVRFDSGGAPIVGTSLDYFDFRGLRIATGEKFAILGECVLGARLARERGVGSGDFVISSPKTVFDLAGAYPLKMRVTGVLAPSGTADDRAIFVDVKTAWVIEGLFHGHQDLAQKEAASRVLKREGNNITANASVVEYTEITPANVGSFHAHGDPDQYPITAVVAVPHDQKAAALLRGRYTSQGETRQIVRPREVMDELVATIFTVERYVIAAVVLVASATLATVVLVFLLSFRLRRREIETMVKIGGSRAGIAGLLALEVGYVLVGSVALAGVLTWLTTTFGADLVRGLIVS